VPKGLLAFALTLAALFLLRLFFGFVAFPVPVAEALSVVNAALFVGLPIYALYAAASHDWRAAHSLAFLGLGALLHVGGALLARFVAGPGSGGEVVFMAVVQTGILCWTLGLGTLLALFIKDKNLLIPIAVFLVGFDMFLVFNPDSPTRRMLEGAPQITQSVLATVPAAKASGAAKAGVQDLAQVGPADLLFAAAFFALMFRFQLRPRQTLAWLVPVLVAYLFVVVFLGAYRIGPLSLAMLPAMVPIGLTVLLVNWRSFKLKGEEVLGIVLVALLSIGLAWFGIYRAKQADRAPVPPIAPSQSADDPVGPRSEGSPSPSP
jgi:hypothetical protein